MQRKIRQTATSARLKRNVRTRSLRRTYVNDRYLVNIRLPNTFSRVYKWQYNSYSCDRSCTKTIQVLGMKVLGDLGENSGRFYSSRAVERLCSQYRNPVENRFLLGYAGHCATKPQHTVGMLSDLNEEVVYE